MKRRITYKLDRLGSLLVSPATLTGPAGEVVAVRLLIDTGASFTIIPVEVAERLGCDTLHPLRTIRVIAANGVIVAPVILVAHISCLGVDLENFPVVVHTLPSGTLVDGLLGMDFLSRIGTILDIQRGTIRISI